MGNFLRIFNRFHVILDELDGFDDLTYGWTLDDVDTLAFQLSLSDPKCNPTNMQYANHIEIVDETTGIVIWGGLIAGHDFNDATLKINCLDYGGLMKWRRLRQANYGITDYGTVAMLMMENTNSIFPTGTSIGTIESGAINTSLSVSNTDMLLDTMRTFLATPNYDWDIDVNRNFNFYLAKGADKSYYSLTWGGEADNIIVAPELTEDIMSMANAVYSETSGQALTSLAQDTTSQSTYGLFEGTVSADSSSTSQLALDTQTSGQLSKTSNPTRGFTLTACDSSLCPFSDIFIGDTITVNLIPYFGYSATMRILRMIHDEKTNTRQITVGEVIYKPLAPNKRMYSIT